MKHKLMLIHGAFQGAFVWKTLLPRLQAFDYEVLTPTLSGRNLSEHIQQICTQMSLSEDERFTIVGHSYGSLVATGVAKRLPKQTNGLIYLDAPLPFHPDGEPQSLLDILGEGPKQFFMDRTKDGMVETFPAAGFGLESDAHADVIAQHTDQALDCFTEKGDTWSIEDKPSYPVYYIQCAPNSFTDEQVAKAQILNWSICNLPESGHCPMITHPGALFRLLQETILPKIETYELEQEQCMTTAVI